jgi:hypothetical protein
LEEAVAANNKGDIEKLQAEYNKLVAEQGKLAKGIIGQRATTAMRRATGEPAVMRTGVLETERDRATSRKNPVQDAQRAPSRRVISQKEIQQSVEQAKLLAPPEIPYTKEERPVVNALNAIKEALQRINLTTTELALAEKNLVTAAQQRSSRVQNKSLSQIETDIQKAELGIQAAIKRREQAVADLEASNLVEVE